MRPALFTRCKQPEPPSSQRTEETQTITFADARRQAKANGYTLAKTEGQEVRINKLGATEATAYYTEDLKDALDTMRHEIDTARLADTQAWPMLVMPLKRGEQNRELGFATTADEGGFMVYMGSIYQPVSEATPRELFASAAAVIGAGWRID